MDIHWRKAEGDIPDGEVLAVSKSGGTQIGFVNKENDGSWTCRSPISGAAYNDYLHNVHWYIPMSELLASVPKE